MRLLTDENVAARSVALLRAAGHDVASVTEAHPGLEDPDVIAIARGAGRVLISFDSDIGERIYRAADAPPPGVVYLRFIQADPEETARVVDRILAGEIRGWFVTYRNGRYRRRRLP